MSKLPAIQGAVIDRKTVEMLHEMEDYIGIYHGLRHLWANAVANYADYVATPGDLFAEQTNVLWRVVGAALKIHAHSFPKSGTPHRDYFRIERRPASSPPEDRRTVMAWYEVSAWSGDDADAEDRYEWGAAYYDADAPIGWWSARTGARIQPLFWYDIPKPRMDD